MVSTTLLFYMDRKTEQKIRMLANQVAEEFGFEVADLTLHGHGRRTLLRVAIDKEGGVTLADCESFSRSLEGYLDVEDPIAGAYTLEVSSPGLDRPLRTLRDFEKSIGKLVRVTTSEKIDGNTFFRGRVLSVQNGTITLALPGQKGDTTVVIPFTSVVRAQLEIEV